MVQNSCLVIVHLTADTDHENCFPTK
uniref:Uncharacterized protein n=1 Tax=Rhizophora mucronata TaxID=61149 RepID=A0A2P2N5A8_RHIMU